MTEGKPETPVEAAFLVLLDTPAAMKLAVAWQYLDQKRRTEEEWGAVAGVEARQVKRVGDPLRRCGICRDDGTTHPLALQYIARMMLIGRWGRPTRSR